MDHSHGQLKKEQKYLNFSDMILGWLIPTEKAFCLSLRLSFDLHKQILFLSVWWCWTIEIWPNKQKNHCWSKAHLPCLKKRWEQNDWFNEDFTVNLCSKRHWPVHVYKNHHLIPGAHAGLFILIRGGTTAFSCRINDVTVIQMDQSMMLCKYINKCPMH